MKKALLAIYNYIKNVLITLVFGLCLLITAIFTPWKLPEVVVEEPAKTEKTKKANK